MQHELYKPLADALLEVGRHIDSIRDVLLGHLNEELRRKLKASRPEHHDAIRSRHENERKLGFVGPPQPLRLPSAGVHLGALAARVRVRGGPADVLLAVDAAIAELLELHREYAHGTSVQLWPLHWWEEKVRSLAGAAQAALDSADDVLKAWMKSDDGRLSRIGVTAGDRVILRAQDIQVMNGATLDATQKALRAGSFGKAFKIGKYWHIELDKLIDARKRAES